MSPICKWCGAPLTEKQIRRGTVFHTLSCFREHWHADNPEKSRELQARARAGSRRIYVARLKATLQNCKTLGEAYRLGYQNGYKAMWNIRTENGRYVSQRRRKAA
jgi:hypothetical protein